MKPGDYAGMWRRRYRQAQGSVDSYVDEGKDQMSGRWSFITPTELERTDQYSRTITKPGKDRERGALSVSTSVYLTAAKDGRSLLRY